MADMLHELENNEAILLMYIAGELPEEERREVEQMLASDAGLRATHDELRGAWGNAMAAIETVDRADAAPMNAEVAARQVGRLVRQWHAARVLSPKKPEAAVPAGRRVAWWQTSAAAAAVMFLGFLVYWGWSDAPPPPAVASQGTTEPSGDGQLPAQPGEGASGNPGFPRRGNFQYSSNWDVDVRDDKGDYNLPYFDPTGVADAGTADLERQVESLKLLTATPQ